MVNVDKVHDPVNHPKHYVSHPSGIEVITYTRLLPFGPGNAVKYVMRRGLKGDPVEDIEKALWYLNDSIENHVTYKMTSRMKQIISRVIPYEPNGTVAAFLADLYTPRSVGVLRVQIEPDLDLARDRLVALREEYVNG